MITKIFKILRIPKDAFFTHFSHHPIIAQHYFLDMIKILYTKLLNLYKNFDISLIKYIILIDNF